MSKVWRLNRPFMPPAGYFLIARKGSPETVGFRRAFGYFSRAGKAPRRRQHFLLRRSRAERQQNGPQLPHGAKAQKRSRLVIRPDADMGPSSHALRPQSVRCALAVFIQFPIGTAKTLTDQCRSPGKPPCGLPQHLTDGHVIFSHLSSPDTPIAAAIFLCRRLSGFNVSFPNCALTSQPSQP